MNFYLTLAGGASSVTYPDNDPEGYKVKLPKEIFLPRDYWEVGLATISFSDLVSDKDFLNIQSEYPLTVEQKMLVKKK